jgi:small GTP-binding protein
MSLDDESFVKEQFDVSFKVVLLGDAGVGKSSVIHQYIKGTFYDQIDPTLGVSFSSKTIQTKQGKAIRLEIWDTAGQEKFKNLAPLYYRKASAIILVYDLMNF